MTMLVIDANEFPNFDGQEIGRELELELTAVVVNVIPAVGILEGHPPPEGGIPSGYVVMQIVRADITQTT